MAHLSDSDRIKIQHYLDENYSYRQIAKLLNVNVSTISREVKRNIRKFNISKHSVASECVHLNNCKRLIGSSRAKMCSIYCPDYQLRICNRFKVKNSKPICNSCPNNAKCRLARQKYDARIAINKYDSRISSRPKVNFIFC